MEEMGSRLKKMTLIKLGERVEMGNDLAWVRHTFIRNGRRYLILSNGKVIPELEVRRQI